MRGVSRADSVVAGVGPVVARERPLMWRLLSWALVIGAAFSLAGRLLFPGQQEGLLVGLAITGGCLVGALVLRLVPDRLPDWTVHLILAAGTIAISVEIYANVEPDSDDELFYLWVTIFAFYFLRRRAALLHMILIGVGYWVAIFARDEAMPSDRLRWLVTLATLTIAGLVVHHLAKRQQRMIDQLSEAARTDPLTALLNRKGFNEAFGAQLAATARRGGGFGLTVGDLDRFKQVNDRLGHAAGDETLKTLARLLQATTRGGDRPARLGGEEFAVLVPDADRTQAFAAAERLRLAVEREFADSVVPITISFGVAVYPQDGETADELMLAADRALYAAKAGGRNRTVASGGGDADAS